VLEELSAKGVGCVLVVNAAGHLVGTFTDGDLRRTLQERKTEVLSLNPTVYEIYIELCKKSGGAFLACMLSISLSFGTT